MAVTDYRRNCVLDVFDYSGHKTCTLYDSSSDVSGQATDVVVHTSRNGWKELSFNLPSKCQDAELGDVKNYRLEFLKADYRIRLIDDSGTDWFLISEPKVTHKAFSQDISVNAGHIAQLLKTKKLDLEFSDEEGNNVGTARELLETILEGTGWVPGEVETFYEKDGTTEKKRSLKAPVKTGAFKMISSMCDLFEAKPIYHGEGRTVDIVHMNPFSKPDGGLPDLTSADGVIELHYGKNISNVSRTLNTENIATKLHVYGAPTGDTSAKATSIGLCKHYNNELVLTSSISANTTYWFNVVDLEGTDRFRHFTAKSASPSGSKLIWSELDPASMMYIWDVHNQLAYSLEEGIAGTELSADVGKALKENYYDFLQDYTYYKKIGLLTDEHLQDIAEYQVNYPTYYKAAQDASAELLEAKNDLSILVGSDSDTDYCRLNVDNVDNDGSYVRLNLNTTKPVMYRSDYEEKERDYFKWYKATHINAEGDPVDSRGDATDIVASVIYIIHNTNPVTWDKVFIKTFNNEEKTNKSTKLTLWILSSDYSFSSSDRFYLFGKNNINGGLGGVELGNEASTIAVRSIVMSGTVEHPVYYTDTMPAIDDDVLHGYGWLWKYDTFQLDNPGDWSTSDTHSVFYFCYYEKDDRAWKQVHFQNTRPIETDGRYWLDWQNVKLYHGEDGQWVEMDEPEDKLLVSDFQNVYKSCRRRDKLRVGYYEKYTYTLTSNLSAGSYYFPLAFDDIILFTTNQSLSAGNKIIYETHMNSVVTQVNDVETLITSSLVQYDSVKYEGTDIIYTKKQERYSQIPKTSIVASGTLKGIWPYIKEFPNLMDDIYLNKLVALQNAQNAIKEYDNTLTASLGDMYREGYFQKDEYIQGDEDKLYDDALEVMEKVSHPEATYSIGYLDEFGSNIAAEYGVTEQTTNIKLPNLTTATAAHLVDDEIDVNVWAFIDEIKDCKDQPWKSSISINTNLSTITQHSFTDVLTNIANVANEISGKTTIYGRATALTGRGNLAAERLEGALDAAKLKLFGGASTWMTDDNGNMLFIAADGQSAMTLTGNGLAIANGKDSNGQWNWRTAATGAGIVADAVTTGYLSAERIEAESITVSKLAPNVGEELDIGDNETVIRIDTELREIEQSIEHFGSTYIQETDPHYDPDTGETRRITYGDYWIKAKNMNTWAGVLEYSWGDIREKQWFELASTVEQYVWNTSEEVPEEQWPDHWQPVSDTAFQNYIGTKVSQTQDRITLEAERSINAEEALSARIDVTAEAIKSEVQRGLNGEGGYSSVYQTADQVTQTVENKAYGKVSQVAIDVTGVHIKASAETASSIDITPTKIDVKSAELNVDTNKLKLTSGGSVVGSFGSIISDMNQDIELCATTNGSRSAGSVSTVGSKIQIANDHINIDSSGSINIKGNAGSNAISMNSSGINIQSGGAVNVNADGTFTVNSSNFSVDENGDVTIKASSIDSPKMLSNGSEVLTKADIDIWVSETQPDAKLGRIWIKPISGGGGGETPTKQEVVYTHQMRRGIRQHMVSGSTTGGPYGNSGRKETNNATLTGTPTAAIAGATGFAYKLNFPVYASSNVGSMTLTAHLISGANNWTSTVTASYNAGSHTVEFTFNINQWLGNLGSIRFYVETTSGGTDRYNVLNGSDSTQATLVMTCHT